MRGPHGGGRVVHGRPRGPLAAARPLLALVVAVAAGEVALAKVRSFLAPRASAARRSVVQADPWPHGAASLRSGLVVAATDAAAADRSTVAGALPRPRPPNSTEAMTRQAADAAMSAYKDGITRQTVRLRLDAAYRPEDAYFAGIAAKLKGTMPLAESFTRKLWGGELLKNVRSQGIDEEVATLLYRQASDNLYDSAVFFLTGRSLIVQDRLRRYFDMMGDRLVVMLNSEDAADPFKVQNQGKDFVIGEDADAGAEVTQLFKEITYYYSQGTIENWQFIEFHAYPHPWEIWVENLNYDLEKIADFDSKPTYDELVAATRAYEEKGQISTAKKMAKMMKDQGSEFDSFAAAQLDPGEGRML